MFLIEKESTSNEVVESLYKSCFSQLGVGFLSKVNDLALAKSHVFSLLFLLKGKVERLNT